MNTTTENNRIICRNCGGTCNHSKGIVNYHNIQYPYDNSKAEFETKMQNCFKCVDCGHSFILSSEEESCAPKKLETEDLFNHYEELPKEVKTLIDEFNEKENSFENCETFKEQLNKLGFSCEFGLDATPYNLKKI